MIYTDGTHLISDTSVEQLHLFASVIGLKRHYFHGVKKGHPHYDLTNEAIKKSAINNGAQLVSTREIVRISHFKTKLQLV